MDTSHIIPPVDRELIKKELKQKHFLRKTNRGNKEIYITTAHLSPNIMREIGRLRELSFTLEGGLHEGATQLQRVGQYVVDEMVAVLEQFRRGGGYRAVVAGEHVAAVVVAVAADDFLVLGVPHEELLAAVGVGQGVVFVYVDLLASAAAVGGEAQLAQASYLAHDVGREVRRGDVNLLLAAVGLAQEMLLFQFFFDELAVNGRGDV